MSGTMFNEPMSSFTAKESLISMTFCRHTGTCTCMLYFDIYNYNLNIYVCNILADGLH